MGLAFTEDFHISEFAMIPLSGTQLSWTQLAVTILVIVLMGLVNALVHVFPWKKAYKKLFE